MPSPMLSGEWGQPGSLPALPELPGGFTPTAGLMDALRRFLPGGGGSGGAGSGGGTAPAEGGSSGSQDPGSRFFRWLWQRFGSGEPSAAVDRWNATLERSAWGVVGLVLLVVGLVALARKAS